MQLDQAALEWAGLAIASDVDSEGCQDRFSINCNPSHCVCRRHAKAAIDAYLASLPSHGDGNLQKMQSATGAHGDLVERLLANADLQEAWDRWEQPADPAPAPLLHKDTAELLRAAATALRVQEGWRDISTAPKDGTWVLGYENPEGMNTKYAAHVVMRWRSGGSWRNPNWYTDGGQGYIVADPTDWQPLPAAPSGDSHG